MSTKTTFKRIALVAVAALGFGVLTSVAPASAAGNVELATSIAVGTADSHRPGLFSNTPIVINLPSTAADTDTIVLGVALTSCPATSTLCAVSANPTQSAFAGATNAGGASLKFAQVASGSGSNGTLLAVSSSLGYSSTGSATAIAQYAIGTLDSVGQVTVNVAFKPDVAGVYTFLVSTPNAITDVSAVPATNNTFYTPTANDTSISYAITTKGQATAATLAAVTTGGASGTGEYGNIYKLTLTDSAGSATLLGTSETITLTSSDTSVTFANHDAAPGTTATSMVVNSSGNAAGGTNGWVGNSFYFRADNSSTTSESFTITATSSGVFTTSFTASLGASLTAVTATSVAFTSIDGTSGGLDTSAVATSASTATARAYNVVSGDASHTLRATITTQAANVESWTVTDTSGKITGIAAAKFGKTITNAAADTYAYKDVTISAVLNVVGSSGQSFTATLNSATTQPTITFTAASATKTAITVTNSNRRVEAGSSNTFVATLADQTETGMANESVTVTVAGRNGATASSTLVTNASGEVTYTLADTGTVGTTDTITFTSGSITGSATLTYGTTTVTTLDILGPNDTAANTPDTTITLSERTGINAAKGGASGTVATVTVTAKDANGVLMSGVPVTFSVAGTTAAILSTKVTVYTGAAGTAATSVYAWATGSYVVTATAGGKTATSTVYFAQKEPTYARTISAVVSGGTVTATVKDRYGNVVPNVTVWATKTGTGYFGSGSSSASGTTNEAGVVDFYINGSASVTLSLGSTTAADANYGQSGSAVGYVKQGDGATPALTTASTVGTATTAETGVGAAFAPAGINSVTVAVETAGTASDATAQAAADAAAEATDAANAATDAANAAAEAADAATAAAQDAADAVAALSTQVSEMVNALKKQITALTNLVIKIQKKVKA